MIPGKRESRRLDGRSHPDLARPRRGLERARRRRVDRRLGLRRAPARRLRRREPAALLGQAHRPSPTTSPSRPSTAATSQNLIMAGRNISSSHVAFTSTRVMATCACTGQAVGTAAALCAAAGITPRELRRLDTRPAASLLRATRRSAASATPTPKTSPGAPGSPPRTTARPDPAHVLDGHVRDVPGSGPTAGAPR